MRRSLATRLIASRALRTGIAPPPGILSFNQSIGSELLTDGGFDAWTGSALTNWTSTANPPFSEVNQRASNQGYAGTGTGSVNLYTPLSAVTLSQTALTSGQFYQTEVTCSYYDAGSNTFSVICGNDTNTSKKTYSATGTYRALLYATQTAFSLYAEPETGDVTFSNASCKRITPLTAGTGVVSGTTTLTFASLPGSPVTGDCIELRYRWVDNSNHWVMVLEREASRWSVYLYSVVNNVRTLRRTVTNVGSDVTGIRVTVNSSSVHQMYTAVGSTYTLRGATVTNTTHNTASGVHALYTSSFSPNSSWDITAT